MSRGAYQEGRRDARRGDHPKSHDNIDWHLEYLDGYESGLKEFNQRKESNMKDYTVLLRRPDYIADEFGDDTYLTHVNAGSVQEAQTMAQQEAFKADSEDDDDPYGEYDDYAVIAVIEGAHYDVKEA